MEPSLMSFMIRYKKKSGAVTCTADSGQTGPEGRMHERERIKKKTRTKGGKYMSHGLSLTYYTVDGAWGGVVR